MDSTEFLHSIWGLQGEGYAFLSFREGGFWQEMPLEYPGAIELPDLSMGDMYFCPNLFRKPRRRKEYVLPSCWLYADLDEVKPRHVEVELSPSIAIESSPGRYQALWRLDKWLDVDEHQLLNKKLTYALCADQSGWDTTQVLRVPGTINHKYDEKPPVRLLWEDEEEHQEVVSNAMEVQVPSPKPPIIFEGTIPDYSPREMRLVFQEVPSWIRMRLRAKTAPGDRSKVLWKIMCGLLDAGFSGGEVFLLVKNTVWNKHEKDQALWADISRAEAR